MKTVRRPPYPKWNPGYFPCSSLTPSAALTPSIGGFGLILLLMVMMAAGGGAGVMAAGGGAGVMAAEAVTGTDQTTDLAGPPGIRGIATPGDMSLRSEGGPPSVDPEQSGEDFTTGTAPRPQTEERPSEEALTSIESQIASEPISLYSNPVPLPPLFLGNINLYLQVAGDRHFSVTMRQAPLGDVNLDGYVDMEDLLRVFQSLGTIVPLQTGEHGNFLDIAVDLNGDGHVDVLDLAIVAAHLWERTF